MGQMPSSTHRDAKWALVAVHSDMWLDCPTSNNRIIQDFSARPRVTISTDQSSETMPTVTVDKAKLFAELGREWVGVHSDLFLLSSRYSFTTEEFDELCFEFGEYVYQY